MYRRHWPKLKIERTTVATCRCTLRYRRTACTWGHTRKAVNAHTAASGSHDRGYCRVMFVPIQESVRSAVHSAPRRSPTSPTFEHTSRRTPTTNRTRVRGAGRRSRSKATCISTKSHRACVLVSDPRLLSTDWNQTNSSQPTLSLLLPLTLVARRTPPPVTRASFSNAVSAVHAMVLFFVKCCCAFSSVHFI